MNELRCPHRRADGRPCGQKLGDAALGYYRTTCPRCKKQVVIVTGGMLNVNDDGRPVRVTVDVEEMAPHGARKTA